MGKMSQELETLPCPSSPTHPNCSRVELGKHSIYQQEVQERQAHVSDEFEGVQKRFPQDAPLWHVDYFELKSIETLRAQDMLLPSLKELKLRALPVISVIIRKKFLCPICTAERTSNYWPSAPLIAL